MTSHSVVTIDLPENEAFAQRVGDSGGKPSNANA
jgi:hypothetical protein